MGDHVTVTVTAEKLMETATSITENHATILMEDLNATPEAANEEITETAETEEENTGEEGDHVIVTAENLTETATSITENHVAILIGDQNATPEAAKSEITEEENTEENGECRYCQEQECVSNLISPCNCTGSLKYIHKSCLDKWYNVKGCCVKCEICNEDYPDFYPLPIIISSDEEEAEEEEDDDITSEISEESEPWTTQGTNTQIHSPEVVAEPATNRPTFGMILGMALLLLVGGLLIRDAIECFPPKEETFKRFIYFIVVTLTVPIYIMLWIYKFQQCRTELRQREIETMERERSL